MERFKRRLDILRNHHKKCEASHAAYTIAQMDLPFEMDSSTHGGSISDQPTSIHNHDGLMVFAAPDSSTTVHELPPLKAGTSKSESSKKMSVSFQHGSDKKHSSSSDAHNEAQDSFSNSVSWEVYQPSSTPSCSYNETLSKKKSSRHIIPEKDHCHQSMKQLKDGEERHSFTKKPHAGRHKKGKTTKRDDYDADEEGEHDVEGQQQTTRRPKAKRRKTATKHDNDDDDDDDDDDSSDDEWDEQEQSTTATKSSAEKGKKTAAKTISFIEGQQQTTRRSPAKRQKTATKHADDGDHDDWSDDERDGKEQPMMNTSTPIKRRKKTSTKQKHDEDSDEQEPSITATKSSAKKGKKTAAETRKTDAKIQLKRPWTDREKRAVWRQMARFIVLRKVPRKNDCLLCIGKEASVLHTRTWKDVKYFVYNEMKKLKRKLEREEFY